MKIFIDCEFNSTFGALISMGMISEDGQRPFYEVVDFAEPVDPWVLENVMPILEKDPIPYKEFQKKLHTYLNSFPTVHIIADHPADILRICQALIVSGGKWLQLNKITFEANDRLSAKKSKVPHNAFHDAVAVRDSYIQQNDYFDETV